MTKWSKWLEPGEEILWSKFVEGPEQATTLEAHKATRAMFDVIAMLINYGSIYFFVKAILEKGDGGFLLYGLLMIALAWGLGWFADTKYGKKLKDQTDRNIYQNGIVTDRRAVFFNHFNGKREEYLPRDIKGAVVDYENGGLALRIIPAARRKRAVLVGVADFEAAKNIIIDRLLESRTS